MKKHVSSSAETVANIEELLTEILLRVPAETLISFKRVSKHWLNLISNPSFCNSHTLQNPNYPKYTPASAAFILLEKLSKHYYFISPLGFRFKNLTSEGEQLQILDSRHGVLLCRLKKKYSEPKASLCVVNVTTSQCLEISLPVVDDDRLDRMLLLYTDSLAVDPRKPHDYKVVRTLLNWTEFELRTMYIRIYYHQTRSWRMIECTFTQFHPLASSQDNQQDSFLFHISDRMRFNKSYYAGESGGHLHLIIRRNSSYKRFHVLELERDYSCWFVKYEVNLDRLDGVVYPILFLAREENETAKDDSCMFLNIGNKLVS